MSHGVRVSDIRVVRLDGPERLPEALALIQQVFAAYQTLVPPSSATGDTVEKLTKLLSDGAVFLAEEPDGTVVGAVCAERRRNAVYLGRLAVLPDRRGRGIAGKLVAAVEAFAAEVGAGALTIGVRLALPGNIRMFQRLGFVETGRTAHPGFTEATSMDMAKTLGPIAR